MRLQPLIKGGKNYSTYAISNNTKILTSSCKNLVIWGENITTSVGLGRYTKQVSELIKIPPFQYSIIVGLLLSDGWMTFCSKTHKNARLGFKQSLNHSEYLLFVFKFLSHYCSSYPHLSTGFRAGNKFYGLGFFTRSLTCFTEIYNLFYR